MKYLLLILIACQTPNNALAQQDEISGYLFDSFEAYSNNTYHEKIYLHLNKPIYLSGETIWFKVYNLDANTHKKSALSKYAYIEIIDQNEKPVLQEIVELNDGLGSGHISLPNTMSSNNYYIRAYTNWMRNFDTSLFFTKSLKIINPFKSYSSNDIETGKDWDVQFFPEGGVMITGTVNTLGIKGIDESGRGFDFFGQVLDSRDNVVLEFKSLKFGIGSFQLTPEENESYRSIIMLPDNTELIKTLPKHTQKGISLSVMESDDHFQIKIKQNLPVHQNSHMYILVRSHGKINEQVSTSLNSSKSTINIEKDLLNDGVNQITLFDNSGLPISERLVFKRPEDLLVIDSKQNFIECGLRSKVQVNLNVKSLKKSVPADLSVSVYRNSNLGGYEYCDIVTELLLSSELKGHVENPNYYFKNTGDSMTWALNNLLLTQGWRRYSLEEVLNEGALENEFIPEYQGYTILGELRNKETNIPIENMHAYLTIVGQKNQTLISRSNSDGNLIFEVFNYYGINDIITSLDDSSHENIVIGIRDPFDVRNIQYPPKVWSLSGSLKDEIIRNSISLQIENNFNLPATVNLTIPVLNPFYSDHSKVIRLDDYTRFPTMLETLQENAKGVQVKKNRGNYSLKLFDIKKREMLDGVPFVLLDGIPIMDINKIMEINPHNIEQIDVVFSDYMLGNKSMHGIVSFSSFDEVDIKGISSSASIMSYQGPQVVKEFYSPKYETKESKKSRKPDFRNALYWNPTVQSNKDGNCTFEFYTSDQEGEYKIHVEGIDENGIPVVKEILLKVEEFKLN